MYDGAYDHASTLKTPQKSNRHDEPRTPQILD